MLTELNDKFKGGKDQENLFVDIVAKGFTAEGMGDAASAAEYVKDTMKGEQYLDIKEAAWEDLLEYAGE